MKAKAVSVWVLTALVGAAGVCLTATAEDAASRSAGEFDRLKEHMVKQCVTTVQPDVLEFMAAAFGVCQQSAEREKQSLQEASGGTRAELARVREIEQKIEAAAGELATLESRRAELDKQVREERIAFAAGAAVPQQSAMDELEAVEAQIAKIRAGKHMLMKECYRLPTASALATRLTTIQTKIESAEARIKEWTAEASRMTGLAKDVEGRPKQIPLDFITSTLKLDPPVCSVSKHWLDPIHRFNLFLVQMDDGQIMGGGLRPEPVQVYQVFGFIDGSRVSLKLVNKRDASDVLTFSARVSVNPQTREATRLEGQMKGIRGARQTATWVFD